MGPQSVAESRWLVVATPPPVVEPAEPGNPPDASVVWVDGQWMYQRLARKWVWEKGAWCQPPPGMTHYAVPALRRVRTQGKKEIRWNELERRGEEVSRAEDEWQWLRGTFFVRDASGAILPMEGSATCFPQTGLGEPTAK